MSEFQSALRDWLTERGGHAQLLRYQESVQTVADAMRATGHAIERITKSIVMMAADGRVVIAVVPAEFRASSERVRKALGLAARPRPATAEESRTLLGQEIGGNTPLNAGSAIVLIDPKVMEKDWIYTGGGDARSLVRIDVAELARIVEHTQVRVRK